MKVKRRVCRMLGKKLRGNKLIVLLAFIYRNARAAKLSLGHRVTCISFFLPAVMGRRKARAGGGH